MQNEQPAKSGDRSDFNDCVKPQDLRVGTMLTVYGRSFLIHDCDAFTQRWLQVLHIHKKKLRSALCPCNRTKPVHIPSELSSLHPGMHTDFSIH